MTLNELQAFVVLSRILSFHSAARALGISQSTLSTQVRRLELDLGVALFNRSTRSVEATAAGLRFLPHAIELLVRHENAKTAVQDEESTQHLKGIVLPSVDPIATQGAAMMLRKANPSCEISLITATGQDALARAEARLVDFIFLPQLLTTGTPLKWKVLLRAKERIAAYAHVAHPISDVRGLTTRSKAWLQTDLLVLDLLWKKPASLQALERSARCRMELPIDAALEWAIAQNGVLVMNAGMARRWVERGVLKALKVRDLPPLYRYLHLMRPRDALASAVLIEFVRALASCLPCQGVEVESAGH